MSIVCSPRGPRWFLVPTRQFVGSFLFLLHINDIPEVVNSNTTSALFADDAKCSRVISNLSECETLQSDLNCLHDWAVLWGLSFNFKKYEVLRVSYYPVSCWQTLHYRCQVTYCDGLGRDLGVPESSNLTWSLNVSIVVAKANRMLRFLRSHWASHGFGPDRKRLLFSTFVRAHLGYASEVWACSILHLWS